MGSERTVAIVPAAGRGERMGGAGNKVFLPLGDRPLLAHTLGVLEDCLLIDEIVVAVGEGERERCRREVVEPFELRKVTGVIRGGASRQESVGLALHYVGKGAAVVVIHDGARPLLPPGLLVRAIEVGRRHGAVVVGLPAGDTVKRVTAAGAGVVGLGRAPARADRGGADDPAMAGEPVAFRVLETLDRRELWQIQTPQVFWRDLADMAYRRAAERGLVATDDAAVVEKLRHQVLVLPGSEENLKVTTPLDLVLARAVLDWRTRRARA